MNYWLMKSEPNVWSIDQQKKAGAKGAPWDGVRNYQAAKNLRGMKKGDLCFFYHSNIGKEIVGIVEDNNLKHNKFVPGVKIPIYSKDKVEKKKPLVLVLAWNFFNEIKEKNKNLAKNFLNIKDLEKE